MIRHLQLLDNNRRSWQTFQTSPRYFAFLLLRSRTTGDIRQNAPSLSLHSLRSRRHSYLRIVQNYAESYLHFLMSYYLANTEGLTCNRLHFSLGSPKIYEQSCCGKISIWPVLGALLSRTTTVLESDGIQVSKFIIEEYSATIPSFSRALPLVCAVIS